MPPKTVQNDSADERTPLKSNKDKAQNSLSSPFLLHLLVITAGTTAASLGYDVGILADALQPMRIDLRLTAWQEEVIVGSLNVLAAVGAILAGPLSDKYGRKATVQWCAWIFVVGMMLMTCAWDFSSMLLGRIITGLGVGVSFLVAPIYITEVAPDNQRGALNTVFDVAINMGILLGYITGFVIHIFSPGNWRLMMGVGLVLPVAVLLFLAELPESPRWLVMRGMEERRDEEEQNGSQQEWQEEAVDALVSLGDCETREQAKDKIDEMRQELGDDDNSNGGDRRWGPNHKLAIGFGFFQQIAGSEAILYYSSSFLQQAGMNSPGLRLIGNCLVGLSKLLPELVAMQLVDKLGRRTLMLTSAILRIMTLFLLCLGFYLEWPAWLMLLFLCSIVFSFSVGLGPFTYLVASENLRQTERSTGMVYCTVANRLTSAIVALTVVSLMQLMGNGNLFLLYSGAAAVSLLFYCRMTETAGMSLEDIQKEQKRR